MVRRSPVALLGGALLLSGFAPSELEPPESNDPDFDRRVRPILADNCFQCHGPDGGARKAGLRLDQREGAVAPRRSGGQAVVPGNANESMLFERVSSEDPSFRMPPEETGKRLTPEDLELLRAWIDGGARWSRHWAFVAPTRPDPPADGGSDWPRGPIDRFVLARMNEHGLEPSPEATREAWLRRVSLDLCGLPPTPAEIDAFLADESSRAYETVVERLFAASAYGERMAVEWLDGARYADTHGYHYDNERSMWPWRDWVINAFARNMPFDQFTIEQLAGDMLPNATLEQRIATGFNRNHPINWEGGIIPEEYLVEYVVDRVGTTTTVWMGLTMGCARCHDHKFDPVTQEEFYRFYDFFNRVPEKGSDGLEGNAAPLVHVLEGEQRAELEQREARIDAITAWQAEPRPELDEAQVRWESETRERERARWNVLDPFAFASLGGAELVLEADGSLFATGPHPQDEIYELTAFTRRTGITAIRLEALADERLPRGGPGRAFHANIVLSELEVSVAPLDAATEKQRLVFESAHADHSQRGFHVSRAIDGRPETGWALEGAEYGEDRVAVFVPAAPFGFDEGTAIQVRLRQDSGYKQHALGRFRLSIATEPEPGLERSTLGDWHAIGPFEAETGPLAYETVFPPEEDVDLDGIYGGGDLVWTRRADFIDGSVHALGGEKSATYLHRTIETPSARTLVVSLGSDDGVKVWLDGVLVHANDAARPAAPDQDVVRIDLPAGRSDLLMKIVDYGGESGFYFDRLVDDGLEVPLGIAAILERPPAERGERQVLELRDHYRSEHWPEWNDRRGALEAERRAVAAIEASAPTTMVMAEMETPRETFVLERGSYDRPLRQVSAGVPAVLPPLPEGAVADRLVLARWLVDPAHPLTARVAVNRLWQLCFGRGLVATADDFGVQGARPSHPELLDWLAVDLVEGGWDLQALLKQIVTSATYRQSSAVDAGDLAGDVDNVWLSRASRLRLPAETIRDAALFASGLLVNEVGGPPVKPYQPAGLWREVGSEVDAFSANTYMQDHGESLYRRSLYTFRKRSVPPPAMLAFDAPTREYCSVTRPRTNTPVQALVLLNDPTFVEAARALAERVLHGADDSAARVDDAFRRVLSRAATEAERETILALVEEQQAAYRADEDAAHELLGVGEAPRDESLDVTELAAWTVVASLIFNLDEAVTRG